MRASAMPENGLFGMFAQLAFESVPSFIFSKGVLYHTTIQHPRVKVALVPKGKLRSQFAALVLPAAKGCRVHEGFEQDNKVKPYRLMLDVVEVVFQLEPRGID